MDFDLNNVVSLIGNVISEKTFLYEADGEKFYSFDLEVPRLSDERDVISITLSERLLLEEFKIGESVFIDAKIKSYNQYQNEKNKLVLIVLATAIKRLIEHDEKDVVNEVCLTGYICKPPIYRTTPFGREITDILLAVNRAYNTSDYIPCVAWGRNARFCANLEVGENVKLWGRIQSRTYEKKFEDGTSEIRRAYEVSISKMEMEEQEDLGTANSVSLDEESTLKSNFVKNALKISSNENKEFAVCGQISKITKHSEKYCDAGISIDISSESLLSNISIKSELEKAELLGKKVLIEGNISITNIKIL